MSGYAPGRGWRLLRRFTQLLALVAIVAGPLLGGWQRLERAELSAYNADGTDLPRPVRDALPGGPTAHLAYERHVLRGGGLAAEYVGIPMMDPVAGTFALLHGPTSTRTWVAWLLPVLLALVAGRVFCGWFCPYGTLARAMDYVLGFVRWRRGYRVPERRIARRFVLGACVALAMFGSHLLLYLVLPHLLVQQALYAVWLLGGGAALLGILAGLFVAGLLFGPTIYCSAVCPTGAALSGLGRARVVKLKLVDQSVCGSCRLCDQACWLQLSPRSGDAGPDCDGCARCFKACPRDNMRIGLRTMKKRAVAPTLLVGLATAVLATDARADDVRERQPTQVLHAEQQLEDVTVAVSIIDMTGMRLGVDDAEVQSGVEISVYVARGAVGAPDVRGELPERDVYQGPLSILVSPDLGPGVREFTLPAPNSPRSSPRRAIYRWRVPDLTLSVGDALEVRPVTGWFGDTLRFTVPPAGHDARPITFIRFTLAAMLVFAGLFALGLVGRADAAS